MKLEARTEIDEEEPLQLLPFVTLGPAVANRHRHDRGQDARHEHEHHGVPEPRDPRRAVDAGRVGHPGEAAEVAGREGEAEGADPRCGHPEHEGGAPPRRREAAGRVQHRDQQGDRGHVGDPDPFGDPRGDVRTRDRAGRVDRGRTDEYCWANSCTAVPTPAARSTHPIGLDGTRDAIRTPATANADREDQPPPLEPEGRLGQGRPDTEDQEDEGGEQDQHDQPREGPGDRREAVRPFDQPAHGPIAGGRLQGRRPAVSGAGTPGREVCWHPRRTPHARAVVGLRRAA